MPSKRAQKKNGTPPKPKPKEGTQGGQGPAPKLVEAPLSVEKAQERLDEITRRLKAAKVKVTTLAADLLTANQELDQGKKLLAGLEEKWSGLKDEEHNLKPKDKRLPGDAQQEVKEGESEDALVSKRAEIKAIVAEIAKASEEVKRLKKIYRAIEARKLSGLDEKEVEKLEAEAVEAMGKLAKAEADEGVQAQIAVLDAEAAREKAKQADQEAANHARAEARAQAKAKPQAEANEEPPLTDVLAAKIKEFSAAGNREVQAPADTETQQKEQEEFEQKYLDLGAKRLRFLVGTEKAAKVAARKKLKCYPSLSDTQVVFALGFDLVRDYSPASADIDPQIRVEIERMQKTIEIDSQRVVPTLRRNRPIHEPGSKFEQIMTFARLVLGVDPGANIVGALDRLVLAIANYKPTEKALPFIVELIKQDQPRAVKIVDKGTATNKLEMLVLVVDLLLTIGAAGLVYDLEDIQTMVGAGRAAELDSSAALLPLKRGIAKGLTDANLVRSTGSLCAQAAGMLEGVSMADMDIFSKIASLWLCSNPEFENKYKDILAPFRAMLSGEHGKPSELAHAALASYGLDGNRSATQTAKEDHSEVKSDADDDAPTAAEFHGQSSQAKAPVNQNLAQAWLFSSLRTEPEPQEASHGKQYNRLYWLSGLAPWLLERLVDSDIVKKPLEVMESPKPIDPFRK